MFRMLRPSILRSTVVYRREKIKDLVNHNQFRFTSKKSTTDAAMAVKEFAEEGLREGLITIFVSLDVKGAFDAVWWPGILKTLQDFNCPKN